MSRLVHNLRSCFHCTEGDCPDDYTVYLPHIVYVYHLAAILQNLTYISEMGLILRVGVHDGVNTEASFLRQMFKVVYICRGIMALFM